jgi:hypothetical protein
MHADHARRTSLAHPLYLLYAESRNFVKYHEASVIGWNNAPTNLPPTITGLMHSSKNASDACCLAGDALAKPIPVGESLGRF